jgi:hypothetical protein
MNSKMQLHWIARRANNSSLIFDWVMKTSFGWAIFLLPEFNFILTKTILIKHGAKKKWRPKNK